MKGLPRAVVKSPSTEPHHRYLGFSAQRNNNHHLLSSEPLCCVISSSLIQKWGGKPDWQRIRDPNLAQNWSATVIDKGTWNVGMFTPKRLPLTGQACQIGYQGKEGSCTQNTEKLKTDKQHRDMKKHLDSHRQQETPWNWDLAAVKDGNLRFKDTGNAAVGDVFLNFLITQKAILNISWLMFSVKMVLKL